MQQQSPAPWTNKIIQPSRKIRIGNDTRTKNPAIEDGKTLNLPSSIIVTHQNNFLILIFYVIHPKFCTYSNNQDSPFFSPQRNMFHIHTSMASNISPWASTKTAISSNICALLHCGDSNVGEFPPDTLLAGFEASTLRNTCPYPTHQNTHGFSIFETLLIGRLMLDWLLVRRKVAVPYDRSEAKTKSAMLCSKRKMSYKSPRTPTNMTWRRLHMLMGSQL